MSKVTKVSKPRATVQGCNPFSTEYSHRVGRNPVKDQTVDGLRSFRNWQKDAFSKLVQAPFASLIAPTGSGKSVVQKSLAYKLVQAGERVIIAVPETTIGDSFNSETVGYRLPDGTKMMWEVSPENFLFNGCTGVSAEGTVQRLIDFVTNPPAATMAKRVLVCTHMTLVMAHQRLSAEGGKAWKGVNVLIDECHHSRFVEDEEGDSEENAKLNNELGKLVKYFVQNRPGRLLLTTATWLRGDALSIIPNEYVADFTEYMLPIDEYLDGLQYLKEIVFKFSVSEYADLLKAQIKESACKTLVYLPPVTPTTPNKLELLKDFQRALGGRMKPSNDGYTMSHGTLRSLDLVDPTDRHDRKEAFELAKRAGRQTPDVIFVQNLFREGADWPEAVRSLVMGARGSLPMVIQMIGRLLRDHPGKSRIEFHMVLPKSITTDIEQFRAYTNTIFMVMALGWQLSPAKKGQLHNARVIQKLMEKLPGKVFQAESEDTSAGELMREALTETVEGLFGKGVVSDEEIEHSARSLMDCMSPAFRLAANASKHLMSDEQIAEFEGMIETNPFKAAGVVFESQWGAEQFKLLRERYGQLPEVTPEHVLRHLFLNRCLYFKNKGMYQDPRNFEGAVELFGSKQALHRACKELGL